MGQSQGMRYSRRAFLRNSAAAGVFLAALPELVRAEENWQQADPNSGRYGPLISDPNGLLDLPQGFSYTMISETGQRMSDDLFTPGRPDGMGCFEGPMPGTVILVRNHELYWPNRGDSPFEENLNGVLPLPEEKIYDSQHSEGGPCPGGTTTIVYDLHNHRLLRSHLSLAGTAVNCAGGITPWGSWLTCEEIFRGPEIGLGKDHGFVFEVPSSETGLVDPIPLTDMGRFVHEATAVDPVTGFIYLTEDEDDSSFYRFLPNTPGKLSDGGRLQALVFDINVPADTRNWAAEEGGIGPDMFPVGVAMPIRWIDIEDPLAREQELRLTNAASGAAKFARGEGITFALDNDGRSIIFACTEGGAQHLGQIWKYRSDPENGTSHTLEMIYECNDASILDSVDNIAFAPWHDLILCEDGGDGNFLRGLSPEGHIYNIARNAHPDKAEFCGACFSPDGSTMFVNVQEPGFTFAITGPWDIVRGS